MDIALAHDSFTQTGGAERVAVALHELYPQSPMHTVVVDKKSWPFLQSWKIRGTALQTIYNWYPHFQHLFPFIPAALAIHKPIPAEVLLSSSSSYAKGFKVGRGTIHINYCHTPTRFLWVDPMHADREISPLLRPAARLYFKWLKRWDRRAARRVNHFIANSREVQQRIKQVYGKDSTVIYPFIDINIWHPTKPKSDYFLVGGRLQRAKKLDIVIQAFNKLQLPLHVVGTGRYENYLRSIAGPTVTFSVPPDDAALRDEYSGAQALIYPQLEDFGLMPLEAAACGTPTIGLAKGGSLETVIPGVTGELLEEINEQTLAEAVKNNSQAIYDNNRMRAHAAQFSKEVFHQRISSFVKEAYENRY